MKYLIVAVAFLMGYIKTERVIAQTTEGSPHIVWERFIGSSEKPFYDVAIAISLQDNSLLICAPLSELKPSDSEPAFLLIYLDQGGKVIQEIPVVNTFNGRPLAITPQAQPFLVPLSDGRSLLFVRTRQGKTLALDIEKSGKLLNVMDLGLPDSISILNIVATPSGDCLLIGELNGDAFAAEVDEHGERKWINTYDHGKNEYFDSVIPRKDGGFIFVGSSSVNPKFPSDVWIVKTDSSGVKKSEKILIGRMASGCSVNDGTYMIVYDKSFTKRRDLCAVNMDSELKEVSNTEFFSAEWGLGLYKIAPTINGGFIFAGTKVPWFWMAYINKFGKQEWSYLDDRNITPQHVVCRSLITSGGVGFVLTGVRGESDGIKVKHKYGIIKFLIDGSAHSPQIKGKGVKPEWR